MGIDSKVSEAAADKLQAALRHDRPHLREVLKDYHQACAQWFAALSDADKSIAKTAADTYRNGFQSRAKQIAGCLPSAPKFPLT